MGMSGVDHGGGHAMSDGLAARPSIDADGSLIRAQSGSDWLEAALLVLIAVKLVFLFMLALNSAFIMDEYWTVVHGLIGIDHLYKEIWPTKTVLYAPAFRMPHVLGEDAVEIMLLARSQMTVLAIGSMGLLYLIARQIGRDRLVALFIVALVLSFRSHVEWSFITRPEPLALFYALAALWLVTRGRGGSGLCLVAGLVSGVAFLTLQKAVYLNLALGLALVGDGLARRAWKDAVASGGALVAGWGLVVGGYYLFFMALGAEFGGMVTYSLAGPALQNVLAGHQVYEGGLRSFVPQVVVRDLLFYLLCVAGLVMSGPCLLRMDSPERRAWIFSLAITILVFSHPAPWPYNFILAVPFLGLWGAVLLRFVQANRQLQVLAVVCVFVGSLSIGNHVRYLSHDNAFQNQTVRRAESVLQPDDRYFDGIGMVVNRQQAGWDLPGQVISWDQAAILSIRAAAERGNFSHLERIFAAAPKVWIQTYRSKALSEVLAPYLTDSYVPIYSNVLLAGIELSPGQTKVFRTWWPGAYRLYRADGSTVEAGLEVDDRRIGGPVRLDKGLHRLRLTGSEGPLYLLPADIEGVAFNMTAPSEQEPLFDRVYTF
jgi:hypothetical protein